jgi:hypothetical protein
MPANGNPWRRLIARFCVGHVKRSGSARRNPHLLALAPLLPLERKECGLNLTRVQVNGGVEERG